MTDNTARRIMPTPQAEWMFELIVALKDQIDDLRIDRDMWRALALRMESGCGCELDAVNKLPEKWLKYTFDNPEATSYIDSADCADELEEALGAAKAKLAEKPAYHCPKCDSWFSEDELKALGEAK